MLPDPQAQFYTLLYLFSSFIQADAAIFAILGIFIVYRIQSLENSYDNAINVLFSQGNSKIINATKTYLVSKDDMERSNALEGLEESEYRKWAVQMSNIPRALRVIRKNLVAPLLTCISHIILSTIGLVYANDIVKYRLTKTVELSSVVLSLYFIFAIYILANKTINSTPHSMSVELLNERISRIELRGRIRKLFSTKKHK